MLKRVFDQSKTWILTGLIILSLWGIFSSPAQAGKVAKALAFDGSSGTIEVATLYETSYAAQKGVMKSLKLSNKLMKKALGFKGFVMLQSQDGKQVIAFSQWQDLTSYQAYTPASATDASKSLASVPAPPVPDRSLLFEVGTVQTSVNGAIPALRGKEAVVQWVQFTAKKPEDQAQILAQVEAMIPQLLKQQPIPQSVLLLKGLEGGKVVLLSNWNCSALFEDVGQPVAIAANRDLLAISDSEQQLYNVVDIIPAEPKPAEE